MSSPVSRRALGECNAIRSWGLGRGELTFSVSGYNPKVAFVHDESLAHQALHRTPLAVFAVVSYQWVDGFFFWAAS